MDFSKLTGQPATIDEALRRSSSSPEGYEKGMASPFDHECTPGLRTRCSSGLCADAHQDTPRNNEPRYQRRSWSEEEARGRTASAGQPQPVNCLPAFATLEHERTVKNLWECPSTTQPNCVLSN